VPLRHLTINSTWDSPRYLHKLPPYYGEPVLGVGGRGISYKQRAQLMDEILPNVPIPVFDSGPRIGNRWRRCSRRPAPVSDGVAWGVSQSVPQ
jgi:hypothetical protein